MNHPLPDGHRPLKIRVILCGWEDDAQIPRESQGLARLPQVVYDGSDEALAAKISYAWVQRGGRIQHWSGSLDQCCVLHPCSLSSMSCEVCGAAICADCVLRAEGLRLCGDHWTERESQVRWVRTRQLFVVFLFSVFLYSLAGEWLDDVQVQRNPPISVGIFQFAAPEHRGSPFLIKLSQGGLSGKAALLQVKDWFDSEYRRYTGSQQEYLQLRLHGPFYGELEQPQLQRAGASGALERLQYSRFWRKQTLSRGIDPEQFGIEIYFVYSSGVSEPHANSRASANARMAVVQASLDPADYSYTLITLAHELAHTLGASDRYDEQMLALYPEGYVEPHLRPLYPQKYAEIMAVDRPLSREREEEVTQLHQVRVGHATAAEMGWIPLSQAEAFYDQAGIAPEDRLPPSLDED